MFHLPGLFVLCCELNVNVLLMAANHRINRAFPAVWWAKHSFGRGRGQVPEQSRRWPWEGEVLEQPSHGILKGKRWLPSITEAGWAGYCPPVWREGGRFCPAPAWLRAGQRAASSELGSDPSLCKNSTLQILQSFPSARGQAAKKSVLPALSSSTTGNQPPCSSWVSFSSWISHQRNALNCRVDFYIA